MKYLLIAIAAALLFIPFLGSVHLFEWDEINFAEAAREMIVSHNYSQVQIGFQPFWEKPPLFIWMQAGSMLLFGVSDFAARFPNALIGIATLVSLFAIGKKLADDRLGLWWVLIYAGSWLPHFYFKSGIIDPAFNYFIFLSVYFAYRIAWHRKPSRMAVFSGIFLGLAVLTKGPVAILVALLTLLVYWLWNKGRITIRFLHIGLIALCAIITTSLWFGYEITAHGWRFVNEFVVYQVRLLTTADAGHDGPFYYHWVVLLLGCFPASIFLFTYFQGKRKSIYHRHQAAEVRDFRVWMWMLCWVILILFSIVKTKIVHYSSGCYLPLSFLAAYQVYRISEGRLRLQGWTITLLLITGLLLGTAITLLPVAGIYVHKLIPLIGDKFAAANLQAQVSWSATEICYGIGYTLLIIICTVMLYRQKITNGLIGLFTGTIITIQLTIVHFTPKIERYSQGAVIDFFISLQGRDVYVKTLGYHSYGQYYYSRMQPPGNKHYYNTGWLLKGAVDKPVYFVSRNTDSGIYRQNPDLEVIGEKNGYVFFKRK
ncbi:MAG TPA: glycosyltransferase family 39 protein [Chitinophaga sp.]|uniref:ArnT family glycosyltransferase n=1 Tax=Chitinophaga sp. TaxID=1869181 RepID=UPI002B61B020|nr:glycosyltransferase family 39 protein [Chitinophaga sp.]HVI46997.1 glycosyltransferase family 39 protein [Chitinophaga sp.]